MKTAIEQTIVQLRGASQPHDQGKITTRPKVFMISASDLFSEHYPKLSRTPLVGKALIGVLRHLFHEEKVNKFIKSNRQWRGMEFATKVLDELDYSYYADNTERRNIPPTGRLLIVSNHPIGTLDGLALLKLISEVRPDVRVIVNRFLVELFEPLSDLFIAVENMRKASVAKKMIRTTIAALENEEAVIIFPAGEVSRIKPNGIKDGPWLAGFWYFVERTKCPILPIHVAGRNSPMFYSLSGIYKSIGTFMLLHEMVKQHHKSLRFTIGELIPHEAFDAYKSLDRTTMSQLLRRHLYQLPKKRPKRIFRTQKNIAFSAGRMSVAKDLQHHEPISTMPEGYQVYLLDYEPNSPTIREIGRLRELAFRQVGEGSGQAVDLDQYDEYYKHLLLWNPDDMEIVGAYRMGQGKIILDRFGRKGFYTSSLVRYYDEALPMLGAGVEMGRSFINPRYWGKSGLNVLWIGIGAFLSKNQDVRYLFGPVSVSNSYPNEAKDLIVAFYQHYYLMNPTVASPLNPFVPSPAAQAWIARLDSDPQKAFTQLNGELANRWQMRTPMLYKQYVNLTNDGSKFMCFGTDPDFNNCIDGNIILDMDLMIEKQKKRIVLRHLEPDENGNVQWRGHIRRLDPSTSIVATP